MAFDCFLYFEEPTNGARPIEGETQDQFYTTVKALELTSYSFGIENPSTIGSASGGGGSGKAKLKEFSISKFGDRCTADFFIACGTGGHYQRATLDFLKAGGQTSNTSVGSTTRRMPYLQFMFQVVFVKDMTWEGDTDSEAPKETVVFVYGAMTVVYTPQDKEGKPIAANRKAATWNQINNNQMMIGSSPGSGEAANVNPTSKVPS